MRPLLAVCLHDVESRTIRSCRLIRDWLLERGIDRVTLLAIPCANGLALEPDGACASWLRERTAAGDAVAQHGMHHWRSHRAGLVRDWFAARQGGDAAEFVGLRPQEAIAAIEGGRVLLHAAAIRPGGFVAPAYAYTRVLRRELRRRFDWYGGLVAIHGRRPVLALAHGLGTSTALKRRTSPAVLRAGARLPTKVLRVDVHPADFELPNHVAALDSLLRRSSSSSSSRRPVTYDELTG